jgi:hypothetical protein
MTFQFIRLQIYWTWIRHCRSTGACWHPSIMTWHCRCGSSFGRTTSLMLRWFRDSVYIPLFCIRSRFWTFAAASTRSDESILKMPNLHYMPCQQTRRSLKCTSSWPSRAEDFLQFGWCFVTKRAEISTKTTCEYCYFRHILCNFLLINAEMASVMHMSI